MLYHKDGMQGWPLEFHGRSEWSSDADEPTRPVWKKQWSQGTPTEAPQKRKSSAGYILEAKEGVPEESA